MPEWVYPAGFGVNTIVMLVTLLKLVWNGGSGLQTQFHTMDKTHSDAITRLSNDWSAKFDAHYNNMGTVITNVGNRIHDIELKAMETRALAAETYMRRDSYHKATDEFKRDVRDAHDDLKAEMNARFEELKDQIGAVSMSIEENRKSAARRPG